MNIKRNLAVAAETLVAILTIATLLVACGGGDSTATTTPAPPTVSGMVQAASGVVAAASGVAVTLKDSAGHTVTTTTGSDGSYQINTQGLTPPFLLGATQTAQPLYGYIAKSTGVANLNQYTTAILQAYYLPDGTTVAKVFGGTVSSSTMPANNQVTLLTSQVVKPILPYLTNAGMSATQVFDPFSTAYTSSSVGVTQVLSNTTLSSSLSSLTITATTGSLSGQSSALAIASGLPTGTTSAINALDLVTITTNITRLGGSVTIQTATMDMCRLHGTPIVKPLPGYPTTGPYDCVATMTMAPASINIAAGGDIILEENILTNTQVHPAVLAYDAAGYMTPIPENNNSPTGNAVTFTVTGNAINVTKSMTVNNFVTSMPHIYALNLGASTLQLTDTVTNVSTTLTVNVVQPIIGPKPIIIPYPYSLSGTTAWLIDGAGKPVVGPGLFGPTVQNLNIALDVGTLGYVADVGFNIIGKSAGKTTLSGQEIFGNLGWQTVTADVCVDDATNTLCNSFTVGGSVTGLPASSSVVLQDNAGDNLTVSANGSFTFAKPVANAATYNVTALTQPTGANCTVSNGTGTSNVTNVTNVAVTCVATNTSNNPYIGKTWTGTLTGTATVGGVTASCNWTPTTVTVDSTATLILTLSPTLACTGGVSMSTPGGGAIGTINSAGAVTFTPHTVNTGVAGISMSCTTPTGSASMTQFTYQFSCSITTAGVTISPSYTFSGI